VRLLLVSAKVVRSSLILVTLMMAALRSSERRILQEPHGVTAHKTAFFIVTAVKTSNLTKNTMFRTRFFLLSEVTGHWCNHCNVSHHAGWKTTRADLTYIMLQETTVGVTASPGHKDRSEVLGNKEP
jgi:hypothetical protein